MELDEFQGLFDNDDEQLRLSDSESKDSLLGSDMLLGPSSSSRPLTPRSSRSRRRAWRSRCLRCRRRVRT